MSILLGAIFQHPLTELESRTFWLEVKEGVDSGAGRLSRQTQFTDRPAINAPSSQAKSEIMDVRLRAELAKTSKHCTHLGPRVRVNRLAPWYYFLRLSLRQLEEKAHLVAFA